PRINAAPLQIEPIVPEAPPTAATVPALLQIEPIAEPVRAPAAMPTTTEAGKIDPSMLVGVAPKQLPQVAPPQNEMVGGLKQLETNVGESAKKIGAIGAGIQPTYEAANKQIAQTQADYKKQEADAIAQVNNAKSMVNTAMADASRVGSIDPARFWSNKGTGEKITAAIAVFLGGVGAGLLGRGGNPALEMIQKSIDQDINAQEQDIKRKQANVGMAINAMDIARQSLGDIRASRTAALASAWGDAERKVTAMQAGMKNEDEKIKLDQLKQQMAMTRQTYEVQTAQLMQNNKLKELISSGNQGVTQGVIEQSSLPREEKDKYLQRMVPGYGFAKDPETAKEAVKVTAAAVPFQKSLQELINLVKEGPVIPHTDRAIRLTSLAEEVQMAYRENKNLTRFSEEVKEFMEKVLPDPSAITNLHNIPKYEAVLESSKIDTRNKLKQYGLIPQTTP